MDQSTIVLIAALSGVCFSLIGVALRYAEPRGLHPLHVIAVCSVIGAVYFGVQSLSLPPGPVPSRVYLLAIIAGVSQYSVSHQVRLALKLGPLSPMWCAMMLEFIPLAIWTRLVWDEPLTANNLIAVGLGALCVVIASIGQAGEGHTRLKASNRQRMQYALVLFGVLVSNSIASICFDDLSRVKLADNTTLWTHYGKYMFTILYIVLASLAALHVTVARMRPPSWRWMIILGLVAAFGSIGGMALIGSIMDSDTTAAIRFSVKGVLSIVAGATFGTVLFGERRSGWWYATVACGVAVVIVASRGSS